MSFIVVYDACVLYPAPLRDLLLELAISELFAAKWTDTIHDEWIRSLSDDHRGGYEDGVGGNRAAIDLPSDMALRRHPSQIIIYSAIWRFRAGSFIPILQFFNMLP